MHAKLSARQPRKISRTTMTQRKSKGRGKSLGTHPYKPKQARGYGSHLTKYGRPKIAHFSEQLARDAAERQGLTDIVVYRCTTCGLWHKAKPKGAAS
jgi:hypothetical protein